MVSSSPRPVVLCILDGFGYREQVENNAVAMADTPNLDRMRASCPKTMVATSGLSVGLPDGQMGNSEVGHMNLGSGRVALQDLPRIDQAIETGELASNPALLEMITHLKATGGTCHLMGLLSPGGVHSHQDHMVALARTVSAHDIPVNIHAILDGRDTAPKSGKGFVEQFERDLGAAGKIVTVIGRYFAMDRDQNWDRVIHAYAAMVEADAPRHPTAAEAIAASYASEKTDEFAEKAVIGNYQGMADGDAILMANFRADRAREILTALCEPSFNGFKRAHVIDFCATTGMVEYSSAHNDYMSSMFASIDIADTLGQIVADSGRTQLRIAETEKYAHITFFFNGGKEDVFAGEDRILIPSPKVATYDLQPEMSAPEVTDRLEDAIRAKTYDLIVVNFANGDMVGHTGILSAAISAVETLDGSLGRLEKALIDVGGVMLVTADHGNAEMMVDDQTGEPHTQHTTLDVPLMLVNAQVLDHKVDLKAGRLADIAPTCLALMGLDQPEAMTGTCLLVDAETRPEA